jgi:hypothetical protein
MANQSEKSKELEIFAQLKKQKAFDVAPNAFCM